MRKLVMEAIGTMFLVMAIGLSGNPLAIGLMLAIMIYIGGHVSGAHYNPAVSLAVWMRGKLKTAELIPYWAAQVVGALAGAGLVYVIADRTFAPALGDQIGFVPAILAEILFTFALASVILTVATAKVLAGNAIYGLAIGLTVTASAYCVGGISGGAFNPAVGIGPIVVSSLLGEGGFDNLPVYLIGPLAGGALAALGFRYLQPDQM